MLTTVAAIMMIIWPGHDIPAQPYASLAVCNQALVQLKNAGNDLYPTVPGFRAWYEPGGPALVS